MVDQITLMIEPVRNNFTQIAASVNDFKKYARDTIATGRKQAILEEFLVRIEDTEDINAHYDVVNFVNELKDMKIHYLIVGRRFPFKSWLDSMLRRIEKFANKLHKTDDNRKLLALVYTAILSKRHTIDEMINKLVNKLQIRFFSGKSNKTHKRQKKMTLG